MEILSIPLKRILSLEVKKMSELTDTHNIQLTDIEIFVLKYILKNLDVDLKLNFFKDGKKISLPNVIGGFVQKLKEAERK